MATHFSDLAGDVTKTKAKTEAKTDTEAETKNETETSHAETGRDQEYVVEGRADQIRTYIQKILNLCMNLCTE
jgi:hypothetical protein